jgi:hypothetical protein
MTEISEEKRTGRGREKRLGHEKQKLGQGNKNWNKAEHNDWDKGWKKDRVDNGTFSRNEDWDMVWNKGLDKGGNKC